MKTKNMSLFSISKSLLHVGLMVGAMLSFAHSQAFIQAESFSTQQGTQLTSDRTSVGFIEEGDFIGFTSFTLPSQFDSIEISLAVPASANDSVDRIILTIGSPEGLKLAFLTPSATSGWDDFQVQTFNAGALSVYAGQTLDFYFTFEGNGFISDIDSFRFIDSTLVTTEAEDYTDQSGTQLTSGGTAVGFIQAGDYFGFEDFVLPQNFNSVDISLALDSTAVDANDRIILTLGGPQGLKLAFLTPSATSGWSDFQIQTFNAGALNAYAGQTIDLYFTFEGTGFICDIDSFKFF